LTIATCHGKCQYERFKIKYNVRKSLVKAYTTVRDRLDISKKFLDNWRRCNVCEIYIQIGNDIFCPCCGWKTTRNRKNGRSTILWRSKKYEKINDDKIFTRMRSDILDNIDKWEAALAQ